MSARVWYETIPFSPYCMKISAIRKLLAVPSIVSGKNAVQVIAYQLEKLSPESIAAVHATNLPAFLVICRELGLSNVTREECDDASRRIDIVSELFNLVRRGILQAR